MITEEQLQTLISRVIEANEKSTVETIRVTVNGKIDHLTGRTIELQSFIENHAKEDKAHQTRVEPYLEGAAGLKVVRNLAIWIAGGLAAYSIIKDFIK